MRQLRAITAATVALAMLAAAGCSDRRTPTTRPSGIVSLTPAGTDLLVAMGLTEQIVGVSSYESNDALRRKLPKIGDYLRVDFERLAGVRPGFLLVQGRGDRLPPGTREKCRDLDIKPVILQIDRLDDIASAVRQIGQAVGDTAAADRLAAEFARHTELLRAASEKMPKVRTLIVFSDSGTQVVGRETFIDDALTLAGGTNVMHGNGYLSIDNEKLRAVRPTMIFLLLPGADEAVVARAKTALATAGVAAATPVVPITDADVLMPSSAAYRLADKLADHLRAGS